MADFSLQDLWWLKPKEQDNPLPALQLGAQMVQHRARVDLQQAATANDIARTSLMREEMLAKQKIQTMLVAGNAQMASAIASVDDWTDEEQVSRVWETGARNPMTVGGKAWLGAQHMHESARTAKMRAEEARSRIAAREERSDLNLLIEERRALLADSTIDVNDARIANYDRDIALEERRLLVSEGNLGLRAREIGQKETRLGLRERYLNERNSLDREEKDVLSGTFDATEKARLRKMYNLKRREVTKKFYGPDAPKPTADESAVPPAAVPPNPIAPENDPRAAEIRARFKASKRTKEDAEKAMQELRELGFE